MIKNKFTTKNFLIAVNLTWFLFIFLLVISSNKIWVWNLFSFIPSLFLAFISFVLLIINFGLFLKTKDRLQTRYVEQSFIVLLTFLLSLTISDIHFSNLLNIGREIETDNAISLFNLNTEFWEDKDTQEDFFDYLSKQNADIYNLQEFQSYEGDGNYKVRDVESLYELNFMFEGYELIQRNEFVTLTKFPVKEVSFNQDNYFMRVDVEVEDQILSIYNVHIPVHVYFAGKSTPIEVLKDVKRRYKLREESIKSLTEDVKNNSNPLIISGDFNTTTLMNSITDLNKITEDSVNSSTSLIPTSWKISGLDLWRIDYVLSKNEVKFLNHENVESGGFSDHKGQKVLFKI